MRTFDNFTSNDLEAVQTLAYNVARRAVDDLEESSSFEGESDEITLSDGNAYILHVRGYADVDDEKNDYYDNDFGCTYTEFVKTNVAVSEIEVVLVDEYDNEFLAPVMSEMLAHKLSH